MPVVTIVTIWFKWKILTNSLPDLPMPTLVNVQLMDQTWRTTAAQPQHAAQQQQERCIREQPALASFVIDFTRELAPDVLGLALYIYVVVMEAFRQTNTRFRRITPEEIGCAWDNSLAFVDGLRRAGHTGDSFKPELERCPEPVVFLFVLHTLTEDNEDEPIDVEELDFWHIVQVLNTVSDCMHDAALNG